MKQRDNGGFRNLAPIRTILTSPFAISQIMRTFAAQFVHHEKTLHIPAVVGSVYGRLSSRSEEKYGAYPYRPEGIYLFC